MKVRSAKAGPGDAVTGVAGSGTIGGETRGTEGCDSAGVPAEGIWMGGVDDVGRSQIGGFGRSGCSTVLKVWARGEKVCKANRNFR